MRTIVVEPPDTSQVRTGTIWRMRPDGHGQGHELLVLTPMTDHVWNVCYWPEGAEPLGERTVTSMMAAEVLVHAGELIAEPLPPLVDMITQVTGQAEEGTQ